MLAGCEAADFALDGGRGVGGGLGQAEDTGHPGFAGDLARCRGGHGVADEGLFGVRGYGSVWYG